MLIMHYNYYNNIFSNNSSQRLGGGRRGDRFSLDRLPLLAAAARFTSQKEKIANYVIAVYVLLI